MVDWVSSMIIPSNLVILLSGTRGVGKNTMAALLKKLDSRCVEYAFASTLKADLRPLIQSQFGIDPLTVEGPQKELLRPIFVAYGCVWREIDIDHWVKRVADQIEENRGRNPQPLIPICTDGRFLNECELLRKRFGSDLRHIDISRTGAPKPTGEEEKHFEAVAAIADRRIVWGNNSEVEQLAVVQELANWLQKPYTPKTHP